ncbi:WD repeat-containing protein PCN-like [Wolffia australiana]
MEKFWVFRNNSMEWKPSAVVALATSSDGSRVAAAREDGSLEIWLVSPGSVGWHCQLTIQGDPKSRVSSLLWFRRSLRSSVPDRLISSSLDGSVSEWDIFSLQQKVILDYIGASIWQMALAPSPCLTQPPKTNIRSITNGTASIFSDSSSESSDSDEESYESHGQINQNEDRRLAFACDDGCIRLFLASESDDLTYNRTFPRVGGRMLSVTWSLDGKSLFSGSSDGFIRCWDASQAHEVYRITVGGSGLGKELCVWSLLFLSCGTLVSGDSSGSVQFWDSKLGTFLQAHSHHKGDVNALEASPSQNRVFSAGSDGQVIMYKLFTETSASSKDDSSSAETMTKWVYARYVRVHTHDIRALTVASPICSEETLPEKKAKIRRKRKPIEFSYSKWAHAGVPMLISAGDDTKLFAYSIREFSKFSPHDICPTPQQPPIKLALDSAMDRAPIVLAQYPTWLDISLVQLHGGGSSAGITGKDFGKIAGTVPLARIKSKGSQRIISSGLSYSGSLFAYSDLTKPSLFELRRNKPGNSGCSVAKRKLPPGLPSAHFIIFTVDSSRLILAGHDRKIYMIHTEKLEVMHVFVPRHAADEAGKHRGQEPPVTRLLASDDGQWLAAVNCFGDIYVFNLEINKQHWFVPRLDGASVTAGGFSPGNSNVLVVTTSSNRVFALDVEARQLGQWSKYHSHALPRRFQEFPGEVNGLSFTPSLSSTSVIIYSSRAMCVVDFGMPVGVDRGNGPGPKRKVGEGAVDFEARNFVLSPFKHPVLFVGHLSEHSLFVVEKSWMDVAKTFDPPVHRHIFGT